MFLFCVYMPCDEGFRGSNLEEYEEILHEISVICRGYDINLICIVGDFNTDVARNNSQSNRLLQFCENENFYVLKDSYVSCVDFTVESAIGTRSCIDHVVATENLYNSVTEYQCIHDVDNTSDHVPVVVKFNLCCDYHRTENVKSSSRCNWYKAQPGDIAKYKVYLDKYLDHFVKKLTDFLDCEDCYCTNAERVMPA